MTKTFVCIVALYTSLTTLTAQVGINSGGQTPNPSAGLDVNFQDKGFLPPRMTTAERDAIDSPADGLMIFNTNTNCVNFRVFGFWKELCGQCTPQPTVASAGPDQINISDTTIPLSANTPDEGMSGTWTIESGDGGSLVDATDPTTTFTGTLGQTYVLRWTISGVCGTSQDELTISMVPLVKRVFITSTSSNGNMGGLSGADNICQTRAGAGGLSGTWKAWLSGGSSTSQYVSNRLSQSSIPYARLDYTVIANNWADLTDGTLAAPININELGEVSGAGQVWTNTTASGGAVNGTGGHSCSDWTSTGGMSAVGKPAEYTLSAGQWTWGTSDGCLGGYGRCYQNCTASYPIYCVEQ